MCPLGYANVGHQSAILFLLGLWAVGLSRRRNALAGVQHCRVGLSGGVLIARTPPYPHP